MKCLSLLLFGFLLSYTSLAISPITGITHFCAGATTPLSDATTGGTWLSLNTSVATINATGHVFGVSPGTSTIIYTVGASSVNAIVTVNPLPNVYPVTGGGGYCAGDSGVHVGLANSQVGVNYLLAFGATSTGPFSGTGSSRDFGLQTAAGTYTVLATISATGCSNTMSGSATVTINPALPAYVSIFASPGDTVCSGTLTAFTAMPVYGGPFPLYAWNVNGVHVGGDSSTYSFTPANGDIVTVSIVSDTACAMPDSAASSDTIAVITRVAPGVNISASPGTEVCQGSPVLLTTVPAYGGLAPVYAWIKNGAFVATGPAYTFSPVNGDTVRCRMTSDYRCLLSDTAISPKITMVVDTPVEPYLAINTSPGTIVLPGQYDTLTAVLTGGGSSPTFTWIVNGAVVAGDVSNIFISNHFSAPYPDSITCIAVSSNACGLSTYTWVYIVVNSLGVNSPGSSLQTLNVFPNPNNGVFTIRGSLDGMPDGTITLEVADVLGRVVYAGNLTLQGGQINARINLANLVSGEGMYLLRLRSGSGSGSRVYHILVEK